MNFCIDSITVDETWSYYFRSETKEQSKQWTQTINGDYNAALLDRFNNILKKKTSPRHDKLIFLHDNAPSHTSTIVQNYYTWIQKHDNIKINTTFNDKFISSDKRANKNVNTKNYELFRSSNLEEWYELSHILNLTVNKFNPSRDDTSQKLKEIEEIINVQSLGNVWSVIAALHPAKKHTERESSYPHYSTVLNIVLNLIGIQFPMMLNQIKRFESLNISIMFISRSKKKDQRFSLPYEIANYSNKERIYFCELSFTKLEIHAIVCGKCMIQEFKNLAHSVKSILSDDWQKFNSTTHCHVCEKNFNLNYKDSYCIPVLFKTCIQLCFIDSFKFLSLFLLTIKGIFPYEYVDCIEKLKKAELSSRKLFYSSIIASYGLDPAYYYILLDFTWDAMLRYAQANNIQSYDPSKSSTYLIYFDVNNLYNNAVFGKTMQNVRNHVNVRLVTRWDEKYGVEAMIAKPNFHSRSVFSENLVAIEMRKLEVRKTDHLLRLSTNRSNFLLLHKTGSAGQPGRVLLIETSDSQREQRLENTAGGVGLPISTFPSMS
ncbi:hypothetical protein ALC53_04772 [Atta colombica]|uniref:PH domain-containing protein n=1 Tax=Atta colombica TaxID=520822 RepID=A0A151I4N0_9HYME|nr:hypothetical protein ALC53_04772 [Atta colombica]